MRIVTLKPYLTDIVASISLAESLVGCTHLCVLPEKATAPTIVTRPASAAPPVVKLSPDEQQLVQSLSTLAVDLDALYACKPDLILTDTTEADPAAFSRRAETALQAVLGRKVRLFCASVRTLQGMYDTFEEIGKAAGHAREGRELAQRVKAQLLDWADNFYERMRNKRVSVVSSLQPLMLAGEWIPTVVELASAEPQFIVSGEADKRTTWAEIATFRPDVIIIAPRDASLEEGVKNLPALEKLGEWEQIPAVKRGEVIFSDGKRLYAPGPKFLQGAAILFSAIAGLESGYITKRDEFFRLRFLELHRHRFL
jgi:iron complex transport system substrate-binding protein